MTQHSNQFRLQATSHCALCRTRLPKPDYNIDSKRSVSKAWEYEVLAFCDLSSSENHLQILTIRANFQSPGTFAICKSTERGSLSVEFCLESECQECDGKGIAHIIHMPCWKFINRSRQCYSAASIYEFARSRFPLFDTGNAFDSEHNALVDFTTTEGLGDTDLSSLLRRFLGLPIEIRSIVSAYCPPSLLTSLHTVSKLSPLHIAGRRPSRTVIELDGIDNTLCAAEVSILGQQYISSVAFKKGEGILVRRADFKGIRFTIGRYGLQALSILYTDSSTSAWLGDPTNGWTGVMNSNSMGEFHVLRDSLKYLRIEPKDEKPRLKASSRVMWDKVLDVAGSQLHRILDTSTTGSVRNFPGWRLCKYIPFVDNNGGISGLTMYCNGPGVTGILAHGLVQQQIGQYQGCPIHFHLQPNERIVSVWLRMPARYIAVLNEPSILVVTNLSRSCLFGPCLPQYVVTSCQYAWVPLIQDSRVFGVFYDVLAKRRCGRITNLGITQDTKSQQMFRAQGLPQIPFPHNRPGMITGMITGIYFSSSELVQISGLRVCQRGPRYTGMSIDHHDGRIDILGQWDLQRSSVSEIYNEREGGLSSITFRYLKQGSGFYVDGIFVNINHTNRPDFTITEQSRFASIKLPSQHSIAWWFSRDYDEIQSWEPTFQEINISTERYNILSLE